MSQSSEVTFKNIHGVDVAMVGTPPAELESSKMAQASIKQDQNLPHREEINDDNEKGCKRDVVSKSLVTLLHHCRWETRHLSP